MQLRLHNALLLLLSTLCLCACGGKQPPQQQEAGTFPVITLKQYDAPVYYDFVGDIQGVQNVEIRARVQGYLQKIYVDEGDLVKKGQPLFKIEDQQYQASVAQANAAYSSAVANAKSAQVEVDRLKPLVEKNVVSSTELDAAQAKFSAANAQIKEAEAQLNNAKINLSYTYIKSPVNGILSLIPYKVGSLISANTLLTTVSNVSQIYAYFNVSEAQFLDYTRSLKGENDRGFERRPEVELILADGSTYPYRGKVETIEGQFDKETGSVSVRCLFPNPDTLLRTNTTGKIRITQMRKDVILVPQKSTYELQDKIYVYVLGDSNKVQSRNFIPQSRSSLFYIVNDGVKPGEKVVYEGTQRLQEGMTISPNMMSMDSIVTAAYK
ncbi:efflux RND transporter periplasmic adaptor subunit [Limibacter armeniacum]|uniref:efflux RND transporter periplasmic adaptor subunit n=1 Tax=Limibacter armeniacum TaxID=466084 RepID=UPI002FE5AA13